MQTIHDTTSILICTAHQLVSDMLQRLLSANGRVIKQIPARPDALPLICLARPDLLLLDTKLIGVNGVAVAQHLHQQNIPTRCILHAYNQPAPYLPLLLAGEITGLLCLRCGLTELNACIDSALSNRSYITPYLHTYGSPAEAVRDYFPLLESLSKREREVLRLLATGGTNDQVAEKLFISYHTVVNHKRNLVAKLRLKGGHELLSFALSVRHLLV
jgi:DNA-binding NarL/FixJ family response regulator